MYIEINAVKDDIIKLGEKFLLSQKTNDWFSTLGITENSYDVFENTWENSELIVITYFEREYKNAKQDISDQTWPLITECEEIMCDGNWKIQQPLRIFCAYKKSEKIPIDYSVYNNFKHCRDLGFEILDEFYYIVDGRKCFDPRLVCRKKIEEIITIADYSILTAFKDYHDSLVRTTKHKVSPFENRSKIEPN